MIRFNNDYNHGAFASILKELGATNSTSYAGYGEDEWCDKAETIIKKLVDNKHHVPNTPGINMQQIVRMILIRL